MPAGQKDKRAAAVADIPAVGEAPAAVTAGKALTPAAVVPASTVLADSSPMSMSDFPISPQLTSERRNSLRAEQPSMPGCTPAAAAAGDDVEEQEAEQEEQTAGGRGGGRGDATAPVSDTLPERREACPLLAAPPPPFSPGSRGLLAKASCIAIIFLLTAMEPAYKGGGFNVTQSVQSVNSIFVAFN
jgi:hypothetical protein